MTAIDSSGHDWQILSRDGDRINHVRVVDFGDIWPTTGTAELKGGEWIRKNPDKLIGKLRGKKGKAKEAAAKSKEQRITELEKAVEVLTRNLEELNESLKI